MDALSYLQDLEKSFRNSFFGNPFSPKKTIRRKFTPLSSLQTLDHSARETELGLEYGPPVLNIGGQSWKFEDGQWITELSGKAPSREMQRLRRRNVQLEEENNLLKLKVEILLDMLTETTIEYHMMEKEVEHMTQHRKRKGQI